MRTEAPDNRFSIFSATVEGWRFVGREWPYLLKSGIVPLIVHMACNFFILFVTPESTTIETFLIGLPASVLFAWFVFIQTRLIVLGERTDRLPTDPALKKDRDRSMRISVLFMLLFNMGVTATAAALEEIAATMRDNPGANMIISGLAVFMMVILFWSVRFGALPLLTAVDYPPAKFLKRVEGLEFSLRVMALGFVSVLPLVLFFPLILSGIIADPFNVTDKEKVFLILFNSPFGLLLTSILSAALTYGLKEMLRKE